MISTQGSRVKEVRKHFKISQEELATAIGIKQPSIANIEKTGSASTEVMLNISQVYKVNLDWLMKGEGEMIVRAEEKKEVPAPVQEGWQDLVKQAMQTIADLVATNKEQARNILILTDEVKILTHKLTEMQPTEKELQKQKA